MSIDYRDFGYGEIGLTIPTPEEPKRATNADHVRAMTDEELAELFAEVANQGGGSCAPGCYDCSKRDTCAEAWLDWLKQEADNG